jgi:hypothetical protein
MPGSSVKNWKVYEALRGKGYSKTKSAKIANSQAGGGKKKKGKGGRKKK